MQNITKSRTSTILKKKPKTIIIGKSNIPMPVKTLTEIRKIKPTAKAFILSPFQHIVSQIPEL